MIGVYLIRHKTSGKGYVGQSVDINRRWSEHKSKSSTHPVGRALSKYGPSAFDFVVLEECGQEQLNDRETHYIRLLGTLSPGGYNLDSGGSARGEISETTRLKLSEAQTAVQAIPGNRLIQSESNKTTWSDPLLRKASSKRAKIQWSDPAKRDKILEANKRPEVKQAKSDAAKSRWKNDPAYRAKMLSVLKRNNEEVSK
jgi:group I intron endonuclease